MNDLAKLLEVLRIIDEMEDYLKSITVDRKIDFHEAQELHNYIIKAKNTL